MSHLPEEALVALVSGGLPADALDAAHEHLDSCADCRRLLAALSRGESGSSDRYPRVDLPIGRGTRIGRYRVTRVVGAGGMGAVYAADDPELGRPVAIKVLHPGAESGAARLRREAQAMAQLVHPNVVHVYDVGDRGSRTWVAMELVEGRTLTTWLAEKPRSREEIVSAFVEAGHGLSAAHKAGLLHRDFKPDNVFVANDGRIKVGDFGLARPVAAGSIFSVPLDGKAQHAFSEGVCGTPAYLAPEVIAGFPASVRSDVFAFCVSLWEGLHGCRPFAGDTPFALLQEARARNAQPASSKGVSRRVRRALLRGLDPDPEARYPSIGSLLRDLRPGRSKRAPAAAAIAVAAAVAATAALIAQPPRCTGAAADLAPAWSKVRRDALENVFRRNGQGATWPAIERALAGFGSAWTDVHTRSCRATRIDGHQSEEVLDRRLRCLTRQREVVAALGDLWLTGQTQLLSRAPSAIASLPVPAVCGGDGPMNAPHMPVPPSDSAPRIEGLRRDLAAVTAWLAAGDPATALPAARDAARSAREIGYPPLEAEALLVLGRALKDHGDMEEAERTVHDATLAAVAAGHEQALAESMTLLTRVVSVGRARVDDGEVLLARAAPVVARLGDRMLSAELELVRGSLLLNRGDNGGARAIFTGLLPVMERLLGSDHPAIGEVRHALVVVAFHEGHLEEARNQAEAALLSLERSMPPDHLKLYPVVMDLATTESQLGHLTQARRLFERAVRIAERSQGQEGPFQAAALGNLALLMDLEGDVAGARTTSERALKIATARAPAHPYTAYLESAVGERAWYSGSPSEALPHLEHALALRQQRLGRQAVETAETLAVVGRAQLDLRKRDGLKLVLEADEITAAVGGESSPRREFTAFHACEALLEAGRPREAAPHCRRTLALARQEHADDHFEVADALRLVAESELAFGRGGAQRAALTAALDVLEKRNGAFPRTVVGVRFALARVLALDEEPRSVELARSALDLARRLGTRPVKTAQMESFLRAHQRHASPVPSTAAPAPRPRISFSTTAASY
jgi:tetratricopeptide (TPR) repeat protein